MISYFTSLCYKPEHLGKQGYRLFQFIWKLQYGISGLVFYVVCDVAAIACSKKQKKRDLHVKIVYFINEHDFI